MDKLNVFLRPPNPNDLNFIYSSWLKSYNDDNYYNPIKGPAYFGYQKLLINKLLNQSIVTIACNPEDNEQIFGYTVYEIGLDNLIIHYCYVKYNFRRLGVCRSMVEAIRLPRLSSNFFHTFRSPTYDKLKHKFTLTYTPKLAWTDTTKPIGDIK